MSKSINILSIDEIKLRMYALWALVASLAAAIGMTTWYLFREATVVAFLHIFVYIAFSVLIGIAMFGAYFHKSNFLLWFLFGALGLICVETFCLIWTKCLQSDELKVYGLPLTIMHMLVLIVIASTCVFAFLWKRQIDSNVAPMDPNARVIVNTIGMDNREKPGVRHKP